MMMPSWAMDLGMYEHPHQGQASTPDMHGHGHADQWTLAPKWWSPEFVGWGSLEASHAPLWWVTYLE
jgi:hypothetical protein